MMERIGITDLDIAVALSLATEEGEAYRTLQRISGPFSSHRQEAGSWSG
jgi:hypothetical protein